MAKRGALLFLAVAALAILGASFVGGPVSSTLLLLFAAGFPLALIVLGASRGGRLGRAAVPIALLLLLVEGSFVALLVARGRVLDGPWIAGLPIAAAIQLYGLFVLPLAVTSIGFALAFRDFDVADGELERLRALGPGRDEE